MLVTPLSRSWQLKSEQHVCKPFVKAWKLLVTCQEVLWSALRRAHRLRRLPTPPCRPQMQHTACRSHFQLPPLPNFAVSAVVTSRLTIGAFAGASSGSFNHGPSGSSTKSISAENASAEWMIHPLQGFQRRPWLNRSQTTGTACSTGSISAENAPAECLSHPRQGF